ncbi:MAG: hypothetical protein IT438_07475 [Phycisphaerales bacterium]|nr:hypothetical protein [Phycisphaerales bacterium]
MRTTKSEALSRMAFGLAALVVAGAAHAVDFPEAEPNDTKASPNVIVGMQPGDTISGLSTGASTTVGGDGSADNFDITTAAAPAAGIYRYRLVITTVGTAGHTGTIRGLTQTAGVPNPGTDSVIQTSSTTSTPARFVQWYANETPSRIIYRVTGAAATTGAYAATLERELAVVGDVPSPISAGGVFFTTVGQTTGDTDIWLYDSAFNAIPLAGNDDNTVVGGGPGTGLQSYLRRTLGAGTYYLTIANYNLANSQPLPVGEEGGPVDPLMDFPNALATSSTLINQDNDFEIGNNCGGASQLVTNTRPDMFDVTIWRVVLTDPPVPGPNVFTAGSASPAILSAGQSTVLSVTLSGTAAAGTVTGDLSAFGLSAAEVFTDADADNIWTYTLNVPLAQPTGAYNITVTGPIGGCGDPPTRTVTVTLPIGGDNCQDAIAITPGFVQQGNNGAATNESPAPPTCNGLVTFNLGVWYTFTASNSNRYVATTCSPLTDFNTRVYVYTGSCGAFTCVNANATASPACPDRSDAATVAFCATPGTQYFILVTNDTTGSGNYELLLSDLGPTCPTNDTCSTAAPITVGTPVGGNNSTATNETPAPPTCNGLVTFNLGLWYTFTASNSNRYVATTCSPLTDFNTRVYVYTGSCGAFTCVNSNATASPACPDRSDAATAAFCATPGTQYFILVTNDTTGSGNFELLLSDLGPTCPTNDGCSTAAPITVGTPVTGNTSTATNETPAPPTCNGLVTFNLGLWYTFTEGATSRRLQASTCDPSTNFNTRVYIYTGSCGAFTCVNANALASPACGSRADAATVTFCSVPGTQYYILVTNDTTGTGDFVLSLTDTGAGCVPPANDDCANGTVITTVPFSDSPFVDTAMPDIDVSCNAAANIESRAGVWYTYTPSEPGSMTFTETGPADVVFSVFTGGADCSGLAEVYCNTNEVGTAPFAAAAGTQYHILVSMSSNTAVIPANYALTIGYIPTPGACCNGTDCTLTAGAAACTTSGGVFQGYGTNCGAFSFTIEPGPAASYVSIAATGQQLATVSNCDDCGETVALPFNFAYLGQVYSSIWVCSNGFAQFGGANNTTFANAVIPTAGVPNGMLCPLWDDMLTTAFGDVYVEAAGVTPNQTFTISWEGVEDFTTDGALQNFQIVLQENGNVKFRYGLLTAEAVANDWTVGYEDQTGTGGASVTGASLGSGDVSLQLTAVSTGSPCAAVSGACCCGSSCSVTTATACVGTNRTFSGSGTVCTPFSLTAPCCRANFNKSDAGPGAPAGVSVQDIFDFLTGYFTSDPCANTNDSEAGPGAPNGVSVQDIFDFLSAYFGGC